MQHTFNDREQYLAINDCAMSCSAIDHISPVHIQISVSRQIDAFQRTENFPTAHACIKRPIFNSVIERFWLDIDGHRTALATVAKVISAPESCRS